MTTITKQPSMAAKSNPDLLRAPSMQSQKSSPMLVDGDDFLRKWSGPILLGPFLPAVFAVITIIGGSIVLNTWEGTCGYSLDAFLVMAIFISYIFLLVYSWAFLGEKIWVDIPFTGVGFYMFVPYTSLRWLISVYLCIFFLSVIFWIVGAWLVAQSVFCAFTAPLIYNFALFLVVTYWLGFFVAIGYLIKLKFGLAIQGAIRESARNPTMDELEEKVFRKKFKELDKAGKGKLPKSELPKLLLGVGLYIPDEELPFVEKELGCDDSDTVDFHVALEWFKVRNAANAKFNDDDGLDSDDGKGAEENKDKKVVSKALSNIKDEGENYD